jgi:(heptosyl)LPS beta-1,4-glucosyltransferase
MRGAGWGDWNLVHFARRECLRFSGTYHENIELNAPEKRVGQLTNFMLHLNDDSYRERMRKSDTYLSEASLKIEKANRPVGYFDILFSFVGEFFYKYFWKRGFFDGVPGLIWAFHAASAKLRAYILTWDEQNRIPREKLEKDIRQMWNEHSLSNVLLQRVDDQNEK